MFHEIGFNSSATKGEWGEHHEAVSAALLAPSEEFVPMPVIPLDYPARRGQLDVPLARSSRTVWSDKRRNHVLAESRN
jgi:hypothetical protein